MKTRLVLMAILLLTPQFASAFTAKAYIKDTGHSDYKVWIMQDTGYYNLNPPTGGYLWIDTNIGYAHYSTEDEYFIWTDTSHTVKTQIGQYLSDCSSSSDNMIAHLKYAINYPSGTTDNFWHSYNYDPTNGTAAYYKEYTSSFLGAGSEEFADEMGFWSPTSNKAFHRSFQAVWKYRDLMGIGTNTTWGNNVESYIINNFITSTGILRPGSSASKYTHLSMTFHIINSLSETDGGTGTIGSDLNIQAADIWTSSRAQAFMLKILTNQGSYCEYPGNGQYTGYEGLWQAVEIQDDRPSVHASWDALRIINRLYDIYGSSLFTSWSSDANKANGSATMKKFVKTLLNDPNGTWGYILPSSTEIKDPATGDPDSYYPFINDASDESSDEQLKYAAKCYQDLHGAGVQYFWNELAMSGATTCGIAAANRGYTVNNTAGLPVLYFGKNGCLVTRGMVYPNRTDLNTLYSNHSTKVLWTLRDTSNNIIALFIFDPTHATEKIIGNLYLKGYTRERVSSISDSQASAFCQKDNSNVNVAGIDNSGNLFLKGICRDGDAEVDEIYWMPPEGDYD